jgi:hypothetical protein
VNLECDNKDSGKYTEAMNWANLSTLLIVLFGTIGAGVTAAEVGEPWWISIPAGVVGLLISIGIAWISSMVAYRILNKVGKMPDKNLAAFGFILYMATPMIFIFGAATSLRWLTKLSLSYFRI